MIWSVMISQWIIQTSILAFVLLQFINWWAPWTSSSTHLILIVLQQLKLNCGLTHDKKINSKYILEGVAKNMEVKKKDLY